MPKSEHDTLPLCCIKAPKRKTLRASERAGLFSCLLTDSAALQNVLRELFSSPAQPLLDP